MHDRIAHQSLALLQHALQQHDTSMYPHPHPRRLHVRLLHERQTPRQHAPPLHQHWLQVPHSRQHAFAPACPRVYPQHTPVLSPQWLEVYRQANLPSPVHLGCLPFQLWYLNLWCYCWVGGGHVKPEVKLVLDEVVHIPAAAAAAASKVESVELDIGAETWQHEQ